MTKDKRYTKKQLHRRKQRAAKDAVAVRLDESFRYKHDDSMRKMMKGVDIDRYLRLAGGSGDGD